MVVLLPLTKMHHLIRQKVNTKPPKTGFVQLVIRWHVIKIEICVFNTIKLTFIILIVSYSSFSSCFEGMHKFQHNINPSTTSCCCCCKMYSCHSPYKRGWSGNTFINDINITTDFYQVNRTKSRNIILI